VRYDGLLLCLLATGVGVYLHPIGIAVRRCAVLALIVASVPALWAYRSVAEGLPYFPPQVTARPEWAAPSNMVQWGMSWIVTQEQEAEFIFPLLSGNYYSVKVPPSAYVTGAERSEVERQLAALSMQVGKPVPRDIDAAFAPLVVARRLSYPVTTFIYKPIERAFNIWGNIYYSYGWPAGWGTSQATEIVELIAHRGDAGLGVILYRYPLQAAAKIALNSYKFVVLAIYMAAIVWRRKRSLAAISEIIVLVGAFAIIRTVFFVSGVLPIIEIRYIAEAFPGLELVSALAVVSGIDAWRRSFLHVIQKG